MESNHPTGGLLRPAGFEDLGARRYESNRTQGESVVPDAPRDRLAIALAARGFWESWEAPTRAAE